MHTCTGCATLDIGSHAWHGAYRRWYDADRAGRSTAKAWGWVADRLAPIA